MKPLTETMFEAILFALAGAVSGYVFALLFQVEKPEYCALGVGLYVFCLVGTLFRGLDRVEGVYEEPQPEPAPVPHLRVIPNLGLEVATPLQRKGLWDYNLPWPEGREILTMYRFSRLLAENPSLSTRRWVDRERLFRRYEYEKLRTGMIHAGLVIKAGHTFQLSKLGIEAVEIQASPIEKESPQS